MNRESGVGSGEWACGAHPHSPLPPPTNSRPRDLMYVILIAPGYPPEMPYFVRGLAAAGAQVLGVADQAEHELPEVARQHLAGYLRVPSLLDEGAVVDAVRR